MKKVGILVGREKTFPEALIRNLNERGNGEVIAEYIKLGGIRHDDPPRYDLVIDRISHEVPFYRATLKRMALEGTIIINNPFWWSADDKFFNYSLARKARRRSSENRAAAAEGLHSRHRQRESAQSANSRSTGKAIVDYVGFPAF